MKRRLSSFFALLILLASSLAAQARIKDLATFEGVRENQLIGYGIVVGLEGTGDTIQNKFTFQAMANMLEKMGITVNPKEFQLRNVASVMVTAKLPPFARAGSQIDVTVSSIGSAKSIQGGVLLMTPLKGANGMVYAAAQALRRTRSRLLARSSFWVKANAATAPGLPTCHASERRPPPIPS